MLRPSVRMTTRAQTSRVCSFHAGLASVTETPFSALAGGAVRPQPRSLAQSVRRGACLRRAETATTTRTSAFSPCCTSTAPLFTNAKNSYARGTEEEQQARQEAAVKEWRDFLDQPVDADGGNAPSARHVEARLPTMKQLNEELPTAAELEKALREGKIDAYATQPDRDED
ncbi:hypothetical protein conserved [Leishmania donovani]|uniref:Uncharacterized protein n=3 Tax=Leishmania donovani species complex TaxID=38574 RepID=A4HRP6_LEIIN|nr:conserved hypothetical protein [Leishmania infantum JPCM5]XP_003857943.1 hypothetical protein, conserved [Leishmania donovani]CAC9437997.1 hypothetical_protein_-_conserved [Leishmania infantum]AYU75653.1 hypothetical protein LdCL_020010300 [Leishmania donovani]TPP43107.1 hypothetical protein CGC21_30025 [Leishmania donovani]TPP43968.1 hypothetical protein CGC20_37100 [Leishmania donovani]CAJ1985722.1 hypothetical protein conserved [Leishmania donovani]|eukprot:XP_001462738.1 conserved hypothetical protein [Leishmania infantum JPCM5]